jgi:hypothetical protein
VSDTEGGVGADGADGHRVEEEKAKEGSKGGEMEHRKEKDGMEAVETSSNVGTSPQDIMGEDKDVKMPHQYHHLRQRQLQHH